MISLYQLGFIFDTELQPRRGAKIPFGIHSACKITSIDHKPGEYFDIHFEDAEGRYHNKRLWAPNGKYPRDEETVEQAKDREARERLAHLAKIMQIYFGREKMAQLPDLEYEPTIAKAIEMLTPVLDTKLVNLKLRYDAEGLYSQFGDYPQEYMEEHVPGQEPTLEYSPWEKSNRCTFKGDTVKNTAKSDNEKDLASLFSN